MMSSTFAEDILNDRDNVAFEGHFRQLGPRLLIFDRPSPGGLSFYGQPHELSAVLIFIVCSPGNLFQVLTIPFVWPGGFFHVRLRTPASNSDIRTCLRSI